MKFMGLCAVAAMGAALVVGTPAMASPSNEDEPAGNKILDLNGTPITADYTHYTASFVATDTSTNLSFAFREDPAFLFLDAVSLTTGGGPELLTNGGFEDGPVGGSAPSGWTYLNTFGADFGGQVRNFGGGAFEGDNFYYDGAVQAYDGITQSITTQIGHTYDLSFWLKDNSGLDIYRRVADNGGADTEGNGINLVVYAGGIPVRSGTPEPAAWAMMLIGFGGAGYMIRRRKFSTSIA